MTKKFEFDSRVAKVFQAHCDFIAAPDASAAEADALRRRDDMLKALGSEGRSQVVLVADCLAFLCTR